MEHEESMILEETSLKADGDEKMKDSSSSSTLDCYPYTFTPLLLFCQASYFDKGYSNYNSVAQFFSSVIPVDMLHNVLFDRKNMLYEELYEHVTFRQMLVMCCIDAHFTAFQVVSDNKNKPAMLYYDPLSASIYKVTGDGYRILCLYLLLKCNYADSQHIQENKDHYTGMSSNATKRDIYRLWRKINQISGISTLSQYGVHPKKCPLNLKQWALVNDARSNKLMSTQLTANTCYFQTYLFAVMCKVSNPQMHGDGSSVTFSNLPLLKETTVKLCRYLLEFFVQPSFSGEEMIMRPLTNSNLPLDFYRFESSPYYNLVVTYLKKQRAEVPPYEIQYNAVMEYYWETKILHTYGKFVLEGAVSSSPNTKSLLLVSGTDDAVGKLARGDYYKYRAANFMFGFNAGILSGLETFSAFNSFRKNQLLRFYEELKPLLQEISQALQDNRKLAKSFAQNKYRDYYFMPQFEIGQAELVDLHHYTYLLDLANIVDIDAYFKNKLQTINQFLADHVYCSTNKTANYENILTTDEFRRSKKYYKAFLQSFLSPHFMSDFIGLGFAEINPKEKEINTLTQTVFYTTDLMRQQANRQSFEFEKECINQMARSNYRKYMRRVETPTSSTQKYKIHLKIGMGYTYSKYNTLFHFLNVAQEYWQNPDLSNIQVFGKDVRVLLSISSQKIFFLNEGKVANYHYGVLESGSSHIYEGGNDLTVASSTQDILPSVAKDKRSSLNQLVVTDRVFEYSHLKEVVNQVFISARDVRIKTDNEVLNLCLLSLMLDFGLYVQYVKLLNLPSLECLQHSTDTKELQVEVANLIYEFDKKNANDHVTRTRVEELIFETSYKFLINKGFSVQSKEFKLIRLLNSDPDYQSYVLLVKIYMSLCQINRSSEVDYYKVHCDGEFRIIIPHNFSLSTNDYLDTVTQHYTFSERDECIWYDDLPVFDLRPQQPEINLWKVRFDSAIDIQSMVKYIEFHNVFQVVDQKRYLIFIADNVLLVEFSQEDQLSISINKIRVEVATVFFNEAISFIPCFKYAESEDVVIFTSRNIHYNVSQAGQFCTDYYGMKHGLMECITSEEVFIDLNDEHVFKSFRLDELLTESKTVIYFPDYLLQVPDRQHLINLLDLAVKIRNISFFILVLLYLRRSSIHIGYLEKERNVVKIAGPWKEAILYVLNRAQANPHYDDIFQKQFFDLNQYKHAPLQDFIDTLCDNFTKYQRFIDGEYQIVPRPKQKAFLKRIIQAEKPLTFSEVGSGKTKVILPLLCQTFLSNNLEAHHHFARGGKAKHVLVILVPEHLVSDAKTQVYRYCLNLNFRQNYRVYDDIFALMHRDVKLDGSMKQIFVASFNSFKKALTYDVICHKVWPAREHFLVIADEVDDFLDRNKLVFNICSNKNNSFDRPTLDLFFEICKTAYTKTGLRSSGPCYQANSDYWQHLHKKFLAIHAEIQDASRSINKSFGIFNEYTLRHCSTNIVHDIEGYKGLIARPYESVNRAMPGSYYSDVERTIFLTYVILTEDIAKYDELFQNERKFISFEYWNSNFSHQLDFDDLVYGHEIVSEIVEKYPSSKHGLTKYLYEIILRRMEIRDKSRSVNSIDIMFNFDCIGFTGTPFLDNYPTFDYIRNERQDDIPDMIDRSFYAYTSDGLSVEQFEERFAKFQGQNSNVLVEYISSDFIRKISDEMEMLDSIFQREENLSESNVHANALVDLCGIFKRSTIHDVRNLILRRFGPDRFKYIYHIDPADNRDRVLCIQSENDAQYDEEFYNHMCNTYDAGMRDKIFFFVDNRNVIGKDIPFQLVYQRHYGKPLFTKSVVIAHDVDDFSKIWQAMGRSRTMNETIFSIYKSGMPRDLAAASCNVVGAHDIKKQELTRHLYVHNCDCKIAGNISSIYLTLIALCNLSQRSFYYSDEIVNVFLEKMEMTITKNLADLEKKLVHHVLGNSLPSQIFLHILIDKFRRSSSKVVSGERLTGNRVRQLLRHIVQQKFEQRVPSGDKYDDYVIFLSGEQHSLMEISYTKQQQKQKQKQQNKNQDSDAMGIFDKRNQLHLSWGVDNYFEHIIKSPEEDLTKIYLNLPSSVPITNIVYDLGGSQHTIQIYPTLQFLYSHFIMGSYMSTQVQEDFKNFDGNIDKFYTRFLESIQSTQGLWAPKKEKIPEPRLEIRENWIRQSPQYTIAGLEQGVYVIGMKEQFNIHDLQDHPLRDKIKYIADDMGFVLLDTTESKSVDEFGPYFFEQYILMEVLSKHEVSENVIDYYCNHKELLQRALETYDEKQGKGFICWRFLINETAKAAAAVQHEVMER